jgi:hypothetical protein
MKAGGSLVVAAESVCRYRDEAMHSCIVKAESLDSIGMQAGSPVVRAESVYRFRDEGKYSCSEGRECG